MSEEVPVTDMPVCDPEIEDCEMMAPMDEPYHPDDGALAHLLYGSVAVVNSLAPVLLWFFWKEGGEALERKSLLWWGWYAAWVLHLALWGVPTILFPLTFIDVDFINYLFVFWANLILAAPFSFYWMTAIVFFLAALLWEEGHTVSMIEHWITFGAYLIIAGGTSFVQIAYLEDLNYWYYLSEMVADEEMVEETEDAAEEIVEEGF